MSNGYAAYRIVFAADGVEAGVIVASRLSIREALSELPATDVELRYTGDSPLEVAGFLRKKAQVAIVRADTGEEQRRFAGVVARVREHAPRAGEPHIFTLTIESPFHFLTICSDYKVFLSKTTKEIVSEVFKACGVPEDSLEWRLQGSYLTRDVCTQWGETMAAFVMRLLEEEGIFFFCTHGEQSKIVFADDSSAYDPINGDAVVCDTGGGMLRGDAIASIEEVAALRPGKVTLNDHDFKKPSLDLKSEAAKATPFDRELYFYPGRYETPGEGKRRAGVRMDALVAERSFVKGSGRVFRLAAGHTLEISQGPSWTVGKTWVVRRATHEWTDLPGEQSSYSVAFELLDKEVHFAPMQRTPRPRALGPQTAMVVGPAGEEIHCDEHGRIKVQYTWDRHGKMDDKSSFWVRVSQMHTSGSVVIPRIGWEVLVEFEDGDPDRPIVTGRVYNGAKVPPVALPGQKTASNLGSYSSPGGGGRNEIRMDDGGGSEVVSVMAHKDLNLVVANNKEEKVTTNATIDVGANHSLKVGANQTVKVGGVENVIVGGAQKYSVGAARTKTISGNEKLDVKADRSLTIGASHTIMSPMASETSTKSSLSETVGASCIEAAALGVSLAVAGSASLTIGAAKIEAVATGKDDLTLGARAATVGGAWLNLTGKDVSIGTSGSKATTVGGAWMGTAGGNAELSTAGTLKINVGGAVSMNGAKVIFKVGSSSLSLSGGKVVFKTGEIKLTASGPAAEMAPSVGSK